MFTTFTRLPLFAPFHFAGTDTAPYFPYRKIGEGTAELTDLAGDRWQINMNPSDQVVAL